ncbi:hypothetical protein GYMLUDRAFT_904793 [Collybiopsis luxurians FD-317 M1]|uniref:Uncharacterized protein n=1 Tax=Collybiopsis luxurians FD-317 M1 TaxID=944289 RepID=A0A0D0BI12_9AGAR|nr:hypothetical protein GYMLUDRAFT_904793 [Collybiopsis luxurians FD-317 M1]
MNVWGQHSKPAVTAQRALLKSTWDTYGPDLRLGTDVVEDGQVVVESYHQNLKTAIELLEPTSIYGLLIMPEAGPDISLSIVDFDSVDGIMKRRIRSGLILRLLIKSVQQRNLEDRAELFRVFSLRPDTAPSLDHLFEVLAMQKLANGFSGTLHSLEGCRDELLKLPRLFIDTFENQCPNNVTMKPNNFYVPLENNNATWDAFCYDGTIGYGFQIRSHDIKEDDLLVLQRCFCAAGVKQAVFVIVTPKGINYRLPTKLECPTYAPCFEFYQLEIDFSEDRNGQIRDYFNSGLGNQQLDGMQME